MTTKNLVAKIKRKKGCMYFVDGDGIVWEQEMNKGMSKNALMHIKKKKEERYF